MRLLARSLPTSLDGSYCGCHRTMLGQVLDGGAQSRTGRGSLLMAAAARHGVGIARRRLCKSVGIVTATWYDYTAAVLLDPLRDAASVIVSLLRTTFVPAGMRPERAVDPEQSNRHRFKACVALNLRTVFLSCRGHYSKALALLSGRKITCLEAVIQSPQSLRNFRWIWLLPLSRRV